MSYLPSRIILTRIVALLTSFALFVAAIGIFTDLTLLRTISAIGVLIFGLLTFVGGYWRFAVVCVLSAVLFYLPIDIVFPRYIWVMLDLIGSVGVIALMIKTTDPYLKGTAFETYVAGLFPAQNFSIVTRTHDSSKILKRFVETDVDPDFVFRNKQSGRAFAVECKWRKGWAGHKAIGLGLTWDLWKGERYKAYGEKNKMPVFVAFGIGGTPEKPNETYFLEVERLQYHFLKQSLIKSGKTIHQLGDLKI